MTLLSCRGVSHSFGGVRAVDGVDLDVRAGARHALIGPNGAGKSTLFRLVTGLERPTAGAITLSGADITRRSEVRRARMGISQTWQHGGLFGGLRAAENVALAARRHTPGRLSLLPRRQPAGQEAVRRLLGDVGLADRADVPVRALSHGERKRLEVAVALACRPRLLLLDEPAAGMSTVERAELVTLLRALPGDVTLLFVEHDMDVVFDVATDVTALHLGRVLVTGPPEQVRASTAVRRAYLGAAGGDDAAGS